MSYSYIGEVPFILFNKWRIIHSIKHEYYMPKYYIHDKKLWKLVGGNGSTYYILSKIQVLQILTDGPFEIN